MMIDIDLFKGINDTHGHAVGDRVLAEVSQLLRVSARKDDHVIRLGGEEFLVICQNSDLRATLQAAERLFGEGGQLGRPHAAAEPDGPLLLRRQRSWPPPPLGGCGFVHGFFLCGDPLA